MLKYKYILQIKYEEAILTNSMLWFDITKMLTAVLKSKFIVSFITISGTLCGQLTFRLAWCREHSAVMATELLQPRELSSSPAA